MLGDSATSYDLDSTAADWGAATGTWTWQNIQFIPAGPGNQATLDIADAPTTDVLMGTAGNWTYQDCVKAPYDPLYNSRNPNFTIGTAIQQGHGICVRTFNKGSKTDGGHYALLRVKQITSTTITLYITVWQ